MQLPAAPAPLVSGEAGARMTAAACLARGEAVWS
jgi:hypothetical protein